MAEKDEGVRHGYQRSDGGWPDRVGVAGVRENAPMPIGHVRRGTMGTNRLRRVDPSTDGE